MVYSPVVIKYQG